MASTTETAAEPAPAPVAASDPAPNEASSAAAPDVARPSGALATPAGVAPPSNLLRISELSVADLPEHPAFPRTSTAPSLQAFLHALLTPALQMVDATWPKNWTSGGEKASKPASAKVKLYKWEDNRADQTWHIRRSTHANVADPGTFTWAELDDALRVDHTLKEADYTPDIYYWTEVARWGADQGLMGSDIEGFSAIDMRVVETAHKLPAPLIPRAFAELVVAAKTADGGLIVVQVPVDLRKTKAAFFSNDRNKEEGTSLQKKKTVIMGAYVSIERARTTEKGVIEWTMGTVSDAKGALPQWVQRSQIGGAIAKDVGFVAQWIASQRQAS